MMKTKYKKNISHKVERVLKIVSMAYRGRLKKAGNLAKEFGVSVRTIQRDFNDIRKEINNFDELMPENYTGKSDIAMVKNMFLNFSKAFGSDIYEAAKSILGSKSERTLEIISLFPKIKSDSPNYKKYIAKVKEAVELSKKIRLWYSKNGQKKEYELDVCPVSVVYYDGFLYLLCYCGYDQTNIRTYRFDRIFKMEVLDESFVCSFDRNFISNISSVWGITGDSNLIKVKIRAYDWAKDFFLNFDVMRDQKSIDKKDFVEVSGKVANINEIVPYILKFMPKVCIVENEILKKEINSRVKEYIDKYGK
ncbi:MAG: WYL domain-containing protein [Elusimicrobiota bacterium]